ncbi:MAG: hypothetical protein ACI4EH_05805 [Oliverpabstia sp.]
MKKIKRCIVIFMVCIMSMAQALPIYAYDESIEWYEMVEENFEVVSEDSIEIEPYSLYIMDVMTTTKKLSSSKLGLRADIYCSAKMKSIDVTFYLQKSSGSSWVTISSGSASTATDVYSTVKQMTVSGLSSGTYRTKAVAFVRDYSGFGETFTGYSGSLTI